METIKTLCTIWAIAVIPCLFIAAGIVYLLEA